MSDQMPAIPRRSTMIKNLIPSLPERGKIKIGVKGKMVTSKQGNQFQPPQKLDHFIVTTLARGKDGNFLLDSAFHERAGDVPTEIPVRLLYDDPALNFPTRYACFIGRSLWCSGDGEQATRMTEDPRQIIQQNAVIKPHPVACTCFRQEPSYAGRDRCKMNGNLSVLIDGMGGVGGVWRFRTTSYNSIVGIMSSMAFLRSITGGILANIPLSLRLQPKQATSPIDGTQLTIYVVSLEYNGDISELQDIGHTIALERAKTHISIAHIEDEAKRLLEHMPSSNAPLPGDDAGEIVEEFYPEQVAETEPTEPERRTSKLDRFEEKHSQENYEIIDAEGVVATYEQSADAIAAYSMLMQDAEKIGEAALTKAHDSNGFFLQQLAERGKPEIARRLSLAYGKRRQDVAAREEAQRNPSAGPATRKETVTPEGSADGVPHGTDDDDAGPDTDETEAVAEVLNTQTLIDTDGTGSYEANRAEATGDSSPPATNQKGVSMSRGIAQGGEDTTDKPERDPAFWDRSDGRRPFKDAAELGRDLPLRLRESRTWEDTEDLERHNRAIISKLSAADRSWIAGMIAKRRDEIRGQG